MLCYLAIVYVKHDDGSLHAAVLKVGGGDDQSRTLDRLRKELDECREYHDRLHVVADHQIAFDLDDGVVVNYAKFGDILAKIK